MYMYMVVAASWKQILKMNMNVCLIIIFTGFSENKCWLLLGQHASPINPMNRIPDFDTALLIICIQGSQK